MMNTKYQLILEIIFQNSADFISWPKRKLLLLPGVTRVIKNHQYPEIVKKQLRDAGITSDTRSNGPAICSFLFAGGLQPSREDGKGWNIHHIYDGNFPYPTKMSTIHTT